MIFGEKSRVRVAALRVNSGAWGAMGLVVALFCLILGGCSGGSGGNNPAPTPTPSAVAGRFNGNGVTLIGNVVDKTSGAAVSGAVVSFNGYYTTTDNTGNFSFVIPPTTAGNVLVRARVGSGFDPVTQIPVTDGAFYDTGLYSGAYVSLGGTGIPVAASSAGNSISLGTIFLYSKDGPPPPPSNL